MTVLGRWRRRPGNHVAGATEHAERPAPLCNAPFSSLYLDPRGEVRACCQNQYHRLGNVREQPLREIWRGPRTAALRRRLEAQDLSLGCELCAVRFSAGLPDAAYLHVFDNLRTTTSDPEWPQQLELALSNACNLQCVMCNGDLSSAIRIHREERSPLPTVYDDGFFEELDEFLPHLRSVVFLGGEPFLGREPLRVMERLIQLDLNPTCHVTTNGTQWSPRIERILTALPMHTAISIDGFTDETVSAIRVGVVHAQLVANVVKIRDAAKSGGGGCSLTFCLMASNWWELGDFLGWSDELDLDVFVNTVTYPPRFSLAHLPGPDFESLLAELQSQDGRRRGDLRRNRQVWIDVLDDLEATGRARTADRTAGTPVLLDANPATRARRRCEESADERGVITVATDENQVIRSVRPDPSDALGMDLTKYIGSSLADLVVPLTTTLGATQSVELIQHDSGVEERVTVLGDGANRTRLTAVLAPSSDGTQQWFLSAVAEPRAD